MHYKFVKTDNTAAFNRNHDFTEHIASGQFRSVKGDLELCRVGFHVADENTLVNWFQIGDLYKVSVKGDSLSAHDKTAHRSLRFDRKIGTVTPEIAVKLAQWSAKRAKEFAESTPADSYYAESAKYAEYAAESAKSAEYAAESAKYAKSAAKYAKYAEYAAEYAAESAKYAEYAAKYAKYAKYAEYAAESAKSAEYAAEYAKYAKSAAESAESFRNEWTTELVRLLEEV